MNIHEALALFDSIVSAAALRGGHPSVSEALMRKLRGTFLDAVVDAHQPTPLQLAPGDALVAHFTSKLDNQTVEGIESYLQSKFPGHPVVVLDGGLQISTINRSQAS